MLRNTRIIDPSQGIDRQARPYYYYERANGPSTTPSSSSSSMISGNISIGYIMAITSGLFFVWLLIVTILLGVLFNNSRNSINHIEQKFSVLNSTNNEYLACCSEGIATENCTCLLPGSEVSCWNAKDNVPMLQSGVPPATDGILYVVCQPGDNDTTLDGNSRFDIGDYVLFVPDSGKWFVNKAMGGSGFFFQTFSDSLSCPEAGDPNPITFTAVMIDPFSYWITFESTQRSFFSRSMAEFCFFDSGPLITPLQDAFGSNNLWLTRADQDSITIENDAVSFRIDESLDVFAGTWSNDLWTGNIFQSGVSVRFPPSDMFYTTTI